jgi:hypothetical protein
LPSVLVSKIRRRIHSRILKIAASAIAMRPIHAFREARYARAIDSRRFALPVLCGQPAKIVSDLMQHGLAQARLSDLGIPDASDILSFAQRLVEKEMADFQSQVNEGMKFVMMRAASVAANPQLYLFGLHPQLLDLAESYIGLPVAYDGASIQYTAADGLEVSTRDWHRDREDRKVLKIIVYLNDVDADGGPFQILRDVPISARPYRYLYSLTPEERSAVKAGAMGVPIACEGPEGTAVIADTAKFFHRGKPATGRPRAALFFSYFAQRPMRPFFCDRSGLPRHKIRRIVEGLAARQRSAALWQESLTLPWRMIPPASVR